MEISNLILKKSANKLAMKSLSYSARSCFVPIDYTRTRELPTLIELSGIIKRKNEKLKILDVSSPQLLSVSLANFSSNWDITYINPFMPELDDMEIRKALLNIRNIKIVQADITGEDIHKSLSKFDFLFSCSVFEHIYPEEGGDVKASTNVGGLLNAGGKFIFSVPFYKKGFHEYKKSTEYGIHEKNNEGLHFFQRFYDEETLKDRIINPTKLSLDKIVYIGERYYFPNNIKKRFSQLVGRKWISLFLGRYFPIFSKIFMCQANDSKLLRKPYLAFASMIKKA
jgi:hypothetical protein